jgi:dTDP-4-dehydrorhamnose reductase
MNKTLLITGGSGYLGSQLIKAAAAAGWQVYATYYSRPFSPAAGTAVPLDLRDADKTRSIIRNIHPQAIIHAACSNHGEQPFAIVPAAMSVASAAREFNVRLVHVSSDTVFDGEHPPYADEAAPAPIMGYGRAKAEAETLVGQLCFPAIIVRPSLIWGLQPLDRQTRWLADGVRRGEHVMLFTDEYRNPVYIHDLCAALLELAGQPSLQGRMNLGGAQSLNRWDFGLKLLRKLNLPPGPNLTPGTVGESGLTRPRNLTLVSAWAERSLQAKLRGVDEVLAQTPAKG